jgi:hypothetical protein
LRGRVLTKRLDAITSATKKPAPERIGSAGLTWALLPLVVSGTVDGGVGRFRRSGAIEVVVVVGPAAVVAGGNVYTADGA